MAVCGWVGGCAGGPHCVGVSWGLALPVHLCSVNSEKYENPQSEPGLAGY